MYRHWQGRAFMRAETEGDGAYLGRFSPSTKLEPCTCTRLPCTATLSPRATARKRMHASSGGFRRWCLRDSSPIVQHGPEGCTISVKVRKCRHRQGELARGACIRNYRSHWCVRALAPTPTHRYTTRAHRDAVLGRTCGGLSWKINEDVRHAFWIRSAPGFLNFV